MDFVEWLICTFWRGHAWHRVHLVPRGSFEKCPDCGVERGFEGCYPWDPR